MPTLFDLRASCLSVLRSANRRLAARRRLRRAAVWVYCRAVAMFAFLPPPRCLVNGPPKAGTHLLSDTLALLPRMLFSGRHFSLADFVLPPASPSSLQFFVRHPQPPLDVERLRHVLGRCRQGMFLTGHARYHPVFAALCAELGLKHVVILRDPRDVVVSHMHFVCRQSWHHHHRHFRQLDGDDARLLAAIEGFGGDAQVRPLSSIAESYAGFAAWRAVDDVLMIRFEDLVGSRGGGSDDAQRRAIERLADFVGRPLSGAQVDRVARRVFSRRGLTFRRGIVGDWRNHFTDVHRDSFKRLANPLLVDLGYENDDAW